MKTVKIANKNARQYVTERRPFTGSNLFAEQRSGDRYIVFSYGHHHPLFLHDGVTWYENTTRFSVSTTRHAHYARPSAGGIVQVDTAKMHELVSTVRPASRAPAA